MASHTTPTTQAPIQPTPFISMDDEDWTTAFELLFKHDEDGKDDKSASDQREPSQATTPTNGTLASTTRLAMFKSLYRALVDGLSRELVGHSGFLDHTEHYGIYHRIVRYFNIQGIGLQDFFCQGQMSAREIACWSVIALCSAALLLKILQWCNGC